MMADKTNFSFSKVKRLLAILQKKRFISRQGSKKYGKWVVSNQLPYFEENNKYQDK